MRKIYNKKKIQRREFDPNVLETIKEEEEPLHRERGRSLLTCDQTELLIKESIKTVRLSRLIKCRLVKVRSPDEIIIRKPDGVSVTVHLPLINPVYGSCWSETSCNEPRQFIEDNGCVVLCEM